MDTQISVYTHVPFDLFLLISMLGRCYFWSAFNVPSRQIVFCNFHIFQKQLKFKIYIILC